MKKILNVLKFVFILIFIQKCFIAYADLGDGNELSLNLKLIVGRYNTTTKVFTPLAQCETVLQNEILVVRTIPTTDYLVSASSYDIMFDKTLFSVQGSNKAAFIVNSDVANIDYDNLMTLSGYTSNHYYDYACTSYSDSTAIPDESWPASIATGEEMV